jgi:hypothetical protein
MTRSNRTLTQFAVDQFKQFASGKNINLVAQVQGNTTTCVHLDRFNNEVTFQVFLFDICIFEADSTHLIVRNGGFFDSKGRPSRTTRERLNGLLDAAGELGWIPEGVRAFLANNGQKDTCFIGKGETCGVLDSQCPDRIIARNPEQLLVF